MVRLTVVCVHRMDKDKMTEKIPLYVVTEYMNENMGDYDEDFTQYEMLAHGSNSDDYRGAIEYQWVDENIVDVMQPCTFLPTMGYKLHSFNLQMIPDGDCFVEIDENIPGLDTYSSALPRRNVARSIKSLYPQDKCVAEFYNHTLKNKCQKELGKLTVKVLGFNIDSRKDLLGQYVIVKTSKRISRFEITRHIEGNGLLCEVDYIGSHSNVTMIVDIKDKIGRTLTKNVQTINSGKRLFLLPLGCVPERIGYEVCDVDGVLVKKCTDTTFIGGFTITTRISQTKNVIVKDEKGNKKSHAINVGQIEEGHKAKGENNEDAIWLQISDQISKLRQEWNENNLDFIFIDGSREGNDFENNREKADNILLKILKKSTKEILIADPYFDSTVLLGLLYRADRGDAKIKIIRDKDNLRKGAAHNLAMAVDKYLQDFETKNLECKALMGNAALHVRFILLDHCGWMIGCSLNSFGKSSTTITRIPNDSLPNIRNTFMKWWNNSAMTKEIAVVDAEMQEQNKYDRFWLHLKSAIRDFLHDGNRNED